MSIGGAVSGSAGAGLIATTNSGLATVTVDKGASLAGGTSGLVLSSQSGQASVVNDGLVTGAGAPAIAANMGAGAAALNNNGIVRGNVAAANSGGTLDITNNATLAGAVTTVTGATTGFNNIGTWSNAGGSSITSLTNAGTLSLGAAGSAPSTLNISGAATFTSISFVTVRMNGAASDQIVTGGATKLAGQLTVVIAPGIYNIGQAQQLLASTGPLTGAFDRTVITGGYLTSKLETTATGVSITLGYGKLAPAAETANQHAVAQAFDDATRAPLTGNAAKLMSSIYSQSGAAPLAILNQMNADAPGGAANANLAAGTAFAGTMNARQDALRAPLPADNSRNEVSFYAPTDMSRLAPEEIGRIGVWSAGFGAAGAFTADTHRGSATQTNAAKGAALGLDYRIGAFSAGIAGGLSDTTFRAGTAAGSARGAHAGVHAGLTLDTVYANVSVTGAQYANETSRETAGAPGLAPETQKGRVAARELRARVEVGMHSKDQGFHIAPFAAMEVAALQTGRFAETVGAIGPGNFSLAYGARVTQSTPLFLGVRLDGNLVLSNGVTVTSRMSVAWKHDFTPSRDFSAALTILPGARFIAGGASPDANAVQTRLAMEVRLTRSLAIFASLEGDLSAHYRNITGRGGAAMTW